jgi:hypothetical protein
MKTVRRDNAWWITMWFVLALAPCAAVFGATVDKPPPEAELITVFWREKCTHCKKESEFLTRLQTQRPSLRVQWRNIAAPENRKLYDRIATRYKLSRVTPITVIGRKFVVGYLGEESTGQQIIRLLDQERGKGTIDELRPDDSEKRASAELLGGCPVDEEDTACDETSQDDVTEYVVSLPLMGAVDLAELALPVLAVVLGTADGFNPCAMWALVAFLTALAQVGSLVKMIQFAGLFVLAQGLMYMLILNSWLLAFDFVGADEIVTPLIGIVATAAGAFFLWKGIRGRELTCEVTNPEHRTQTVSRFKALAQKSMTPAVFFGILALALSINVIEFACSVGIPQTFTKILDLNAASVVARQALIGLYVAFYMLDDLVVFGLAIWGIEKLGLTSRYARWSNLVGGTVMAALGIMLLVAPERMHFV